MYLKKEVVPKILESFLNYLTAIRGYSINTVKAYCSDIMQFFRFIKDYKEIVVSTSSFNIFILLQIEEADIIAFLVYLNFNKNNNPYTRQRKLNAIKTFFRWLLSSTPPIGTIKKNPASDLSSIKKVHRIPKCLSLEQAKKIQNVFNPANCNFSARNNAIITLFLSTGIRSSELININLVNVNFENNNIIISGKNNKERIVFFSKYCKEKLLKYIDERYRKEKIINLNAPLFINKYGKRIGIDAVEDICTNAYKLIGLGGLGYTTHTLRHTAASLIYTYVKEDVLLLKEFLGHSHISTTQIYTHISSKKIKEAAQRHPLCTYDKK